MEQSTIDETQRLPEAVLRRLRPHDLAAARCVCKAWHATIDAFRMLDLFPPSLAGFFINYHDLDFSEFFFRPPSRDGGAVVSGKLHKYVPWTSDEDTIVQNHCNGLLLFWTYVANPATRRWAPLPPLPKAMIVDPRYILFDPAVSPHYEVLVIPDYYYHYTGIELEQEWPPSPYIMRVFSSITGNWEERSFARRGDAIGTVADLKQQKLNSIFMRDYSAYWGGQLYVLDQFVMRYE
jgi:hypothetical protein